jgi:hypothetical protein
MLHNRYALNNYPLTVTIASVKLALFKRNEESRLSIYRQKSTKHDETLNIY